MAISYGQVPEYITPVYTPIWLSINSSYSGETGFKYIVQVQDVDGIIATKYIKPFPDGRGKFDLSTLLKTKLGYTFNHNPYTISTSGLTSVPNSVMEYRIFCGHTGSTHTSALSGVDLKYTLNAASTNYDFYYPDYLLTDDTGSFLTDTPREIHLNINNYYTLSWMNGKWDNYGYMKSNVEYIYIDVYTSTTNQPTRYQLGPNPYKDYTPSSFTTTMQNVDPLVMSLGVGPMNLNQIDQLLSDGYWVAAPYIKSTTKFYDVYTKSGSTQTSMKYRFYVDEQSRYGNNQIAFLNRLGQFSYFTFNGKVQENIKQDVKMFKKNRYSGTSSQTTSNSARGMTVYNNEITTQITMSSDNIDQATYNFMEELFTSPAVYLIDGVDAYSLNIIDTDWVKRKVINDKLINFTIKAEYANKKYVNV